MSPRKATKQAPASRPRPGVARAYPGERSLRFQAALAGARLARYIKSRNDLAGEVASFFALDRLNDSSDVASFVARDLARLATAADKRIRALRQHREAYWKFLGERISDAREDFDRALKAKPRRPAPPKTARRRAA